jgi:predicted PurR-regulated permease PerM
MTDLIFQRVDGQPQRDRLRISNAKSERRALLALTDPEPIADVSTIWRTGAQAATIGIFLILFVVALDLARSVLLPVMSALVVGMALGRLSDRATRYNIPPMVSAIAMWLLVIAAFYGVIILLSAPVVDWIGKAPEISHNIKDKLHVLDRPLAALVDLRNAIMPQGDNNTGLNFNILSVVQPAVSIVTPAIGQIFIFLGTLFFLLLGRNRLRYVLVIFFGQREARLRTLKIMNDIELNLSSYLSVVALINMAVGLGAGAIAALVGLPNVIAWVLLAFILNFVPYVGALILEAALFGVGLVTFPSLTHALIAPLLYFVLTTLEGHFITPSIMGQRLTLNPLTVFLALVIWTWLWGPVGAFLAVPILIISLVVITHLFPKVEATLPD